MSKLCEAFNRINSKFGANRVKLTGCRFGPLSFNIEGLGSFSMHERHGGVHVHERINGALNEFSPRTRWLEAIANGKVRDEAGNMVDPK